MPGKFVTMVDKLLEQTPDTPDAKRLKEDIEGEMMALLDVDEPVKAAEALIALLGKHGHELVRVKPCFWRVELPAPRVLELWFNPPAAPFVAALSYRIGTPWGTRQQKRAAKAQEDFYARYQTLIKISDADAAALPPNDRLVLLIGEFEADVNNGGFGQYLENKGQERAEEALRCLEAVGAKRTAGWLSSAMESATAANVLQRIDDRFFNKPQDLASLVMRHLSRKRSA